MKYLILLLVLSIPFVQAEAYLSIPPTRAFNMINGSGGNVTAGSSSGFAEFVEGTGITISFDYLLNEITFAATGGSGINNTISSIGLGHSIVSGQVLNDHQLKGLDCVGSVTCTSNGTDILINGTSSAVGSIALDDLTDVIITVPSYLSMLFYDGVNWIDRIFSINNQTVTNGNFITGINNQTGAITTQTFKGETTTCSGTDKISAYDNQTGTYTCSADDDTSPDTTTASNVGVGQGIFKQITGTNLEFKNLWANGTLSIVANDTDVTITNLSADTDTTKVSSSPQTTATLITDNSTSGVTLKTIEQGTDVIITNGSQAITIAADIANIHTINNVTSVGCAVGQILKVSGVSWNCAADDNSGGSGFTNITPVSTTTNATIIKSNSSNTLITKNIAGSASINVINGSDTVIIQFNGTVGGGFNNIASMPATTAKILADNSTVANSAVFKTLTAGTGITLTNGTQAITIAASSSGGIPTNKHWGALNPTSTSGSLDGLAVGCTILATASYDYNTTHSQIGILSTTVATDGTNGGVHCTATDRNVFRGDQNAYMLSDWHSRFITANRMFIGFSSSATLLPNNADTILDGISGAGLCIRTTDTVYQFCSNDGTGATTYATLTTTEDTNRHYFEVYTTDSGVTWCGKLDGGTAVCTSTAADIPAVTTRLYPISSSETDGGVQTATHHQHYWYLQNDK